ncbi:MAG TPA: nucleoid occlusion factor SlmA [Eoetvoesiella sp.]
MNGKLTSKKTDILTALAEMLKQPHAARITTAALAGHLNQSEAALYRHFANKAAMFDALIALTEAQLFEDFADISATEPNGRKQLRKQLHALLLFTERHPGLTRVLTGDALVNESPLLQKRLNELIAGIEATLMRSAQAAIDEHELPGRTDSLSFARLLMDWVLGRWLRYTQTAWQELPTAGYAEQMDLLRL